jgi:acetyl esterase/lipase
VAVDPQVSELLSMLVASGRPSSMSLPLDEGRRNFDELFQSLGLSEPVESIEEQEIGVDRLVPVRIYRPLNPGRGDLPLVAFFHGGGWVFGSPASHEGLCTMIANRASALVVAINYRRPPEHPFPAPLEDAMQALRWLSTHASGLGASPAALVVAGDSSGGNLAAAASLRARGQAGPSLAFQWLLYPALDPTLSSESYAHFADDPFLSRSEMEWYWTQYVGSDPTARNEYSAPILAKALEGLPPALIQTAENDVLRDEGEEYGRRLRDAGVDVVVKRYEGMVHGFCSMARYLERGRDAVTEGAQILQQALGSRAPS